MIYPQQYKTRFEVKCYKPNIDGKLVLTKIIDTTFRGSMNEQEYTCVCKYPIDGDDFKKGPFCEEVFITIAKNALYCPECRMLNRERQLKISSIKKKEKRREQRRKQPENKLINRNPKLPINKI